jgi:hypothetical protein
MSVRNGTTSRSPRTVDRSVVTPPVLQDAPQQIRARRATHSMAIKRRQSLSRRTTPKECRYSERNDNFRYFIDRQGRQHFNFRQRIWLDTSVQMAFTCVYSLALKTLAVNLLTMATRRRDYRAAGITTRRIVLLAPSFSRECLLSAPDKAWELPRISIMHWVESQLRPRSSPQRRK